jgi:hypothetical protein
VASTYKETNINTWILVSFTDRLLCWRPCYTLSSFSAYFPKLRLCDLHPVCLSVIPPHQILNGLTDLYETWYVYHGNWANLNGVLHKCLTSVCMSVCVSLLSLQGNGSVKCLFRFGAGQPLGKHFSVATNTLYKRIIVNKSFSRRSLSYQKSLWVCLCVSLSLLCNNSVKTSPRQRRILGDLICYAVHVVSKESRPLVLLRTSCGLLLMHLKRFQWLVYIASSDTMIRLHSVKWYDDSFT